MLERLFPRQLDNRYRGHPAALWILGFLIALRLVMSTNSIFNTQSVAAGADGFPIDSYTPHAARAVLMLFALTAVGQLTIAVIALAALVRYRAMVPLMFLIFVADQLARRFIVQSWSFPRSDSAAIGSYIGWGLLLLPLLGLILSLIHRPSPQKTLEEEVR